MSWAWSLNKNLQLSLTIFWMEKIIKELPFVVDLPCARPSAGSLPSIIHSISSPQPHFSDWQAKVEGKEPTCPSSNSLYMSTLSCFLES